MVSPSRTHALYQDLRRALPARQIITDAEELRLYDADALLVHRASPGGVVLARSAEQVAHALRCFDRHSVPFVPRGAGTGLSGGVVPLESAWVIDVHTMNRIVELDAIDRYAVIEPGVINAALDRAAREHGLRFAPDPSSQRVCTVGGNIGENAGGPHCFLHGMTTRHVLGLTVLRPDGSELVLGGPPGTVSDVDWRGVYIGSEGTLGVVVQAVVALVPAPESVHTSLATFTRLTSACRAVSHIIAAGLRPAALEILDRLTIRAVEASVFRAGYPRDAEAVLLIEQEGPAEDCALEAAEIERACRANGATEFEVAKDDAHRTRLWLGRKGAFGAMGRVDRDLYVMDGVVPRRELARVITRIQKIGDEYGLTLSNVFHAGDGNLHPNISFDARDPARVERVLAAGHDILKVCVEAGGTLSGEHGIGLEKRDLMHLVFDENDLDAQRRLRSALEPSGRANPGKVLPTRRHCTETGFRDRRHVKRIERILTGDE